MLKKKICKVFWECNELSLKFFATGSKRYPILQKTGNKVVLKKLPILLTEITEKPFTGTEKPEALKYNFTGLWSRRINQEHRLVYEVLDDQVLIHSAKGHYL